MECVIHVCQRGQWERSLQMLLHALYKSGLRDALQALHILIVNDFPDGRIIPSAVLSADKRLVIRKIGVSQQYERPSLQYLHRLATSKPYIKFLYMHTKGVHWFGTHFDEVTRDWVRYMLHYNVTLWENAVAALDIYDVYGCNYVDETTEKLRSDKHHFSGNFWWANGSHIASLDPNIQGTRHQDEFWLFTNASVRPFIASTVEIHCECPLSKLHSSKNEYSHSQSVVPDKIVIFQGMFPVQDYTKLCSASVSAYAKRHGYNYFWDESEPQEEDKELPQLHFRRSYIIRKAAAAFPDAIWFVWLDSDVYVQNQDIPLQSLVDLTVQSDILYHTTHERPWGIDVINTGFKCVHRDALQYEDEIWSLRHTKPFTEFPWEQKTLWNHIFPRIVGRFWVHEWSKLNCFVEYVKNHNMMHVLQGALFVHMCGMPVTKRNEWAKQNIKLL